MPLFGPRKLKKEKILHEWTALIENAHGKGREVLDATIKYMERQDIPNVHVSIQDRAADGGSITGTRSFLVAQHKLFSDFDLYIGVRDYGKQLFVSWYVVAEPASLSKLFRRDPLKTIILFPIVLMQLLIAQAAFGSKELYHELNLFDTEEITAYVTTIHHAVMAGVKEMMEGGNLDFTKVDHRTKGFLNVS